MNVKKMDKNLELCDEIKFNIEESSSSSLLSLPLSGSIVKKKNISGSNDDCHHNHDDDDDDVDVDVNIDIDNGELLNNNNNNNKNGVFCKDIKNVCHHLKENNHPILMDDDNEKNHQITDNSVNKQELSIENNDDEQKSNCRSLSDDDSVNTVDQQSTNNSTDNLSYLSDNDCIIEEIYLSDDELSKNSDDCIYAYRGGADYVDLTNDNHYGIACGIGLNVGNVGGIGGGIGGIAISGVVAGNGRIGSNNVGVGIGGGRVAGRCINNGGSINNRLNNSNNHDDETDFLEMDFEPDPSSELEQNINDYHRHHHHHHHHLRNHHHHTIDCTSNDYNNKIFNQNKCHNDSIDNNDIKMFPNLILDSKMNNEQIMNTNNQIVSSTETVTKSVAVSSSSSSTSTMKYSEFDFKMTGAKRKKVFDKISTLPSSSTTDTSPKIINKLNTKYKIIDDNVIIISDSPENTKYSIDNDCSSINSNDTDNNHHDNNDDDNYDNKCLDCLEKEFLIKTIGKNNYEIIEIKNHNHKKCSKCNVASTSLISSETATATSASASPVVSSTSLFNKNNFYNVINNECNHNNDKNNPSLIDYKSSFNSKINSSNNKNSNVISSSSSSDKNQKNKNNAFQILKDTKSKRSIPMIPNNNFKMNINKKLIKNHKENSNNYCGHIMMDEYQQRLLLLNETTKRQNKFMRNILYYNGSGGNLQRNVKFSSLNVTEDIIVQALDKLNIAYDKNLILENFNNMNDTQTQQIISDVPDYIVHISKKNCDYKRIFRIIRIASKDKIHIQFIPNSNITPSSSSLSLSETIDVSVNDILQYWNHNNDLGKLKRIKNKRFIEMNVLGKIINLIRQAQQKNTKQLSEFIKIPQYYKTGYICITKD